MCFGRIPPSVESGSELGKLEAEKSVRRLLQESKQNSMRGGGKDRKNGVDTSVILEVQVGERTWQMMGWWGRWKIV